MNDEWRASGRIGLLAALVVGVAWFAAVKPRHGRLADARAELESARLFCEQASANATRAEDPRVILVKLEQRAEVYNAVWTGGFDTASFMRYTGEAASRLGLTIERVEPGPIKVDATSKAGQSVSVQTFRLDLMGPWSATMILLDQLAAHAAPIRVVGLRLVGMGDGVRTEVQLEQHHAGELFPSDDSAHAKVATR